jgi:hypothetical protein
MDPIVVAAIWGAAVAIVLFWKLFIDGKIGRAKVHIPSVVEIRPLQKSYTSDSSCYISQSGFQSAQGQGVGEDEKELQMQIKRFQSLIDQVKTQEGIPSHLREKIIKEYMDKIEDLKNKLKPRSHRSP